MQRTPFNPHSPAGKDSSCLYAQLCLKATPSVPVRGGLSESVGPPRRGAGQPGKSSPPPGLPGNHHQDVWDLTEVSSPGGSGWAMLESFVFIAKKPPRLKIDRRTDKSVLVYSHSDVCSTGNVNDLEPHLSSLMGLEVILESASCGFTTAGDDHAGDRDGRHLTERS